jgi:hypothetical protein
MPARQRAGVLAALASLALALGCCTSPAPARTFDPSAGIAVPHEVAGGGRIAFTVRERYTAGRAISLDVEVTAGSQQIIGPVSGQVLLSAMNGELLVRRLVPPALPTTEVAPGRSARLTVVWDGKDESGAFAPAETYSLTFDFVVGGDLRRVGAVIEVVP